MTEPQLDYDIRLLDLRGHKRLLYKSPHAALVAAVGALLGVQAAMRDELPALLVRLGAQVAGEGALVGVDDEVLRQIVGAGKT